MVNFVGAGSGAVDLITVRGQRLLEEADVIVYAGSLVNPGILDGRKESCEVHNSAYMTLEEVIEVMEAAHREGKQVVRLHTGDPSIYGATMVIFLSTGLLEELKRELQAGGYAPDTPAAIVYKATWPDEKVCKCTVETLADTAEKEGITKTALIAVGHFLEGDYQRSELYNPEFTTEFRAGKHVEETYE